MRLFEKVTKWVVVVSLAIAGATLAYDFSRKIAYTNERGAPFGIARKCSLCGTMVEPNVQNIDERTGVIRCWDCVSASIDARIKELEADSIESR